MIYTPHAYQKRAEDFVVSRRFCALFLDMGLGKSVITLTALQRLRDDYLEISRVLVIAPKSVARNTWTGECAKWDHLQGTRVSVVMGTARQRERALETDADLYVTNRDNVTWLVEQYGKDLVRWPFDCVVLDESTSFKNPSSRRFKSLRKVRPYITRMILLTGTPSPNGLMDLWPQLWLLDLGQRLGRTLGTYRGLYFHPGRRNGDIVYEWVPKTGAREKIAEKIQDICLSMKAEEYIQLPDKIVMTVPVSLTDVEMKGYRTFEKEQLLQVDESSIEATTAATLTNKLLQFTGGALYDMEHNSIDVGSSKMEALADLIEAADEPVLVFYAYQHELERMCKTFAHLAPVHFTGEPEILSDWNLGQIRLLLCHPASVAYGLNMQQGGRIIVWYTPTWNLELYEQANARIFRQGQVKPVLIYHLIAPGTMDERVMAALSGKGSLQDELMRRIKELKEGQR